MEQNISATRLEQYKVFLERTKEKESGVNRCAFWIAINAIGTCVKLLHSIHNYQGLSFLLKYRTRGSFFIGLKIGISLGFRR